MAIDYSRYTPYPNEGSKKADPYVTNTTKLGEYTGERSTNLITTTRRIFPAKEPELPDAPTYTAPERDEGRVSQLMRQHAAPGIKKLRQAVMVASSRYYDNPNLRRMTLREALAGYGEGLENVMSGAHSMARADYADERGEELQTADRRFQTNMEQWRANYQSIWNKYMNQVRTVSTTKTGPDAKSYEEDLETEQSRRGYQGIGV